MIEADQGKFRLPPRWKEDGPMPVLFKDGQRDIWNTSTFCGNDEFVQDIFGQTFQITFNGFRVIQSWEER
ncbi:MAG: hypothetical protein UY82_C0026G0003 [Candidatus Uhrbacteria bacterium GW2011_GWC2_53_7]|uniref:Uncharacterized protein n=1 Tax=Candidatus Uhrbacteria bacterium GW2011_GWC2_53_7 TaxID=1618986 RepID=A0A0G1XZ01_9BACT|nr:MAG: hypothetical protein UY82_C0026G0003 [Candidatus Uhrbacteria bacterium GW2011_GWC2_53_7]